MQRERARKSGMMESLRMARRQAKLDLIGLGQSMKPWGINYGTDNTRERSLSKIPRTTLTGRIDLVACFALPETTAPSWPTMWWFA